MKFVKINNINKVIKFKEDLFFSHGSQVFFKLYTKLFYRNHEKVLVEEDSK